MQLRQEIPQTPLPHLALQSSEKRRDVGTSQYLMGSIHHYLKWDESN